MSEDRMGRPSSYDISFTGFTSILASARFAPLKPKALDWKNTLPTHQGVIRFVIVLTSHFLRLHPI